MKRSTAIAICLALTGAAGIYGAIVYPTLPNPAPSHWDINGNVDGYSDPLTTCLLMPGVMLSVLALVLILPKVSPKNFKIESWDGVYNTIWVLVVGLFAGAHFFILNSMRSPVFSSPKFFLCLIFLFFALMGNFMAKVRRNFWVGIRTPWTLGNETVWNVVHRQAARLWVAVGILGVIFTLVGLPLWFSIGLIFISILVPVFHSYFVWRKLEGTPSAG